MSDREGKPAQDRVTRESLHAPFRPLKARVVSRVIAVIELIVVGVPALLVARSGPGAFGWGDRLSILALGAVIAAGIFRFSMLSAIPSEEGIVVHNIVRTVPLEWAQIVSVRFGGGNPWVLLDLDDGDTMAVMAIQRADGARGEAEAQRLATLVALHSQTPRDT
jgi:Bacterial PH domain